MKDIILKQFYQQHKNHLRVKSKIFLNPRNNNNQIETSSINLLNGPNCHLGWRWLCPNPRKK